MVLLFFTEGITAVMGGAGPRLRAEDRAVGLKARGRVLRLAARPSQPRLDETD
jgi:hypothetical protein